MNKENILYSHVSKQQEEEEGERKKCTLCSGSKSGLIKLPEELQIFSRIKNYESWFCTSCIQIVNFMLEM